MMAKLSDPECSIKPEPGNRVLFSKDKYNEILSPGSKIYGRIKEGDEVEIVFPGLYFDDSVIINPLVRRLN